MTVIGVIGIWRVRLVHHLIIVLLMLLSRAASIYGEAIDSCSIGSVYIVLAVDTEPARFNPWICEQWFDLSDFDTSDNNARITQVMDIEWRRQFRDSFGNHPKFTWFLMSHEAFLHAINGGNSLIYDAMAGYKDLLEEFGDETAWHYHHADWTDPDGDGRRSWNQLTTFDGTEYSNGTDLAIAEKQLNGLLVERGFFPTAFRSGWIWENNELSRWLENIIPFDFSAYPPNQGERSEREPRRNQYDWIAFWWIPPGHTPAFIRSLTAAGSGDMISPTWTISD